MSAIPREDLPDGSTPAARRVHVIACGVLALDLKAIAEELGLAVTTTFLPGGLHSNPHELHLRLQEAIDAVSSDNKADLIAIGYGVCGRGTVGLQARGVPLAIAQVHDCIALFLGSDQAYREQFTQYPGTYYVSAGWVEGKVRPWTAQEKEPVEYRSPLAYEFERLVKDHGRENAEAVRDFLNSWHHNYQRAAFINTGEGSNRREHYADMARAMAKEFGWKYEELAGTHDLLTNLLVAPESTEGILIVPPHHATVYDAAQRHLRAVPVRESEAKPEPILIVCDEAPAPAASDRGARLGLGIDAGGTYTDIVIYDFETHTVLQKAKSLTTKWDYAVGIDAALDQLDGSRFADIDLVSVSTTLATNAIVEGRGQRVGLLLMTPCGWPPSEFFTHDLIATITGQLEVNGKELVPVDPNQVRQVVREMLDHQGVQALAVAGFASDVNPTHEAQVKAAVREVTDVAVTCAYEVSKGENYRIRAETAVLNAQIIPCLNTFLEKVQTTIRRRGLQAPIMVVKSDGSLMSTAAAQGRPIETILSGPAASVAGASYLTGAADGMVVDIGGTTTDTASLRHGVVQTCKDGATVGGWKTHVEALDMRTLGLGGDSRIVRLDGTLEIGPQRIAPVAWLAGGHPRTGEALEWLSHHLDRFETSTRGMEVLTLTPYERRRTRDEREARLIARLKERPYSIAELIECEQCYGEDALHLAPLEEDYVVQRCGLTPTDLLHADGQLHLWNADASRRLCDLYAALMHIDRAQFIEQGFKLFVRRLALELLKKELAEEMDPDEIEASPAAMALIEQALGKPANGYSVQISLKTPVIGIGAPAHFFLPAAARLLHTEAIVPTHADVANAIGAITSLVRIHRRVAIVVNDAGLYRIEGLPGTPTFAAVEDAQTVAVSQLQEIVRDLGRQAGTSQSRVEVRVQDRIAPLKDGQMLFIERGVEACLTGRPDLSRFGAGLE